MASRRFLAFLLLPTLWALQAPATAQGQARPFLAAELRIFLVARMTPLMDRTPEQITRDAFASEYGRAVIAEFGRILQGSADAECLRSKQIDAAGLTESGRELLLKYGTSFIHKHRNAPDRRKFEAAFAARAGPGSKAEIARLRDAAEIRRFLELREPLVLASVIEDTTEVLDRYALLERIKLSASLYSLVSRNQAVVATLPYEKSNEAIRDFMKDRSSPQIERWLELERAASDSWLESVDDEALRALLRPRDLAYNLKGELRALCVPGRR